MFTVFVRFTLGFLLDAVAQCTALALLTEDSRSHEVLPTGPVRRDPARPRGITVQRRDIQRQARRPPHPMAAVLHPAATWRSSQDWLKLTEGMNPSPRLISADMDGRKCASVVALGRA